MDKAIETNSVQESKPVRRSGLFSRFGIFAAFLLCLAIGAAVLAAIQSNLQAQSEQVRARQSAVLIDVASPSKVRQLSPTLPSGKHDEIEAEILQMAQQYRNATPSNQLSLGQALTQKLTEVFEARHQVQVARAEKLRTELQQTQELLDKRVQLKSKIIERRVKELTGQQDELSWSPPSSNSNPNSVDEFRPNASTDRPYGSSGWYAVPTAGATPLNPNLSQQVAPQFESQLTQPGFRHPVQPFVPVTGDVTPRALFPLRDDGSYLAPPQLPSTASPPLSSSPTSSPELASPSARSETNPSFVTSENEPKTDSHRSFMAVGFKLKRLIRELNEAKGKLGDAHPTLAAMQNAVDEAKSVWDFERQTLLAALETSESELAVAMKQSDLAIEQMMKRKGSYVAGQGSFEEVSVADQAVLSAEREILQLRFRVKSAKNAMEWANDIEKFFAPLGKPPAIGE